MKTFRPKRAWAPALAFLFAALGLAAAAQAPPAFAGWQPGAARHLTALPWSFQPALARVLQEEGLQSVQLVTYTRGTRQMQVDLLTFRDPYGSFGGFTALCPPDAGPLDIGRPHEESAADLKTALFTAGPLLVVAHLDEATGMTPAEMRALAAPLPASSSNQWPTLPYYLPQKGVLPNSLHFVQGPAGFAAVFPALPASVVGFDMGAEAAVADYDLSPADQPSPPSPLHLAVIGYPTPQIARAHLDKMQAAAPPGMLVKRTGPDVVAVYGSPADSARQLLGMVNYDADVTLTAPTPVGLDALPSMIIAIFVLCGLIIAVAVAVGLMSGGFAVLLRHWFPSHFQKLTERRGVIRLNLR